MAAAALRPTVLPWRTACCAVGGDGRGDFFGGGGAGGGAPDRPDVAVALDLQELVGDDPAAVAQRQPELRDDGVRLDARLPDERPRGYALAVRERRGGLRERLERRLDAELHPPRAQLAHRELCEPLGDLGHDAAGGGAAGEEGDPP